jgi:Tol biopolymer transport system component
MDDDGDTLFQLTDFEMLVTEPAWSPDGTDIRRLTAPGQAQPFLLVGDPTWSPDGQYIAFECTEDANMMYICIMNADGSNVIELTEGYSPAWSPVP